MTKQDHWRPQGNERTDSPPSDVVEQFQQEDLRWAISACRSFQNKIVRYEAVEKELLAEISRLTLELAEAEARLEAPERKELEE